MGKEGHIMFLDMKELFEEASKNEEASKWLKRYKLVDGRNVIWLESIYFAAGIIKSQKGYSDTHGYGGHGTYDKDSVSICKHLGFDFFFHTLPTCFNEKGICDKDGVPISNYISKLYPVKHYEDTHTEETAEQIENNRYYKFKFEINGKKYILKGFLLKYPDWLELKKGLKELLKYKNEFKEEIKDYEWKVLENFHNMIREGTPEENERRILLVYYE